MSSNLEPRSQRAGQIHRTAAKRTMPSVAQQSNDDNDISLSFLLGVWNQWWKWLIPTSILLAIGSAAIVIILFKPKFRADARIEISENTPWVVSQDSRTRDVQFVATQIEMLRSPRVLASVLSDPAIASMPEISKQRKPIEWLQEKGLVIQPVGQSTLVEIAFEGTHPETSARLVNAVIDEYFRTHNDQKDKRTNAILKRLVENKGRQAASVARLQKLVKSLSKGLDVIPDFSKIVVTGQKYPTQDLMDRLAKAEFEVDDLEAGIRAIETSLETNEYNVSPALVQSRIDNLPEVQTLRMEIQANEARLGKIEAVAVNGKSSSAYITTEMRIEELRNQLSVLKANSEAAMFEEVRALDRLEVERELISKKTEAEQKRSVVRRLEKRLAEERDEHYKKGDKQLEFQFASEELQRALSLFAKISERESQMRAELGAPPRTGVYRYAAPTEEPIRKLPFVELGATTLASLILPFGFAFLWESSVRRINSVEQLEAKTNYEVIGEVSRLPARQGRNTKALGHELGLFEESIDSLRTSLLLANEDQDMQVISVCSAVSGEGKTSVASQLAVSIARATGQPVLLIDGDMRAPDIHQIFEIPLQPGLSDVLDGKTSLEESINRSWSEHVHLLSAGELEKSPHKLLGTPAYRAVLDEARLWYRYIIVDTPPVLAASEALVIAKQADGTICCTMRDFSRESHIQLAHTRLQSTGAHIIGTVLNGVPVRSYASRYGSYGRYGYANT